MKSPGRRIKRARKRIRRLRVDMAEHPYEINGLTEIVIAEAIGMTRTAPPNRIEKGER